MQLLQSLPAPSKATFTNSVRSPAVTEIADRTAYDDDHLGNNTSLMFARSNMDKMVT